MSVAVTNKHAMHILLVCASTAMLLGMGNAQETRLDTSRQETLVKTAEQTYRLLLEDYRSEKATGPLNLELLNNWSKRIILARSQPMPTGGTSRAQLALQESQLILQEPQLILQEQGAHKERMRSLLGLVQSMKENGKATAAEVAAAKFFYLEGDALLTKINDVSRLREDRELEIVLPSASEAKPLTAKPKELVIDITRDGQYFVSGKELDFQQTENLLRSSFKK